MTATTATPTITPAPELSRIWNIVRLHLVNKQTFIGIPWIIVGGAWAVSMAIMLIVRASAGDADVIKAASGMTNSWAVLSPLWYMCAAGVLAIAQVFPFTLGFGVTRSDFYLGTSLLFALVSVGNSIGLATLTELEAVTNGWGIGAVMFQALFFKGGSWLANFFIFAVIQFGILFIGAAIAAIYMRWRVMGMLVFWLGLAALLVGIVALVTLSGSWPLVGEWFVAQGVIGAFAWALVPVALAALTGYFILRRATPKN